MRALSILVAEDREEDVQLLKIAFARTGVAVPLHFVSGGRQAIDYLQGAHPFANRTENPLPTMLLLDIKMPGLDGFEVLQWLRLQPGMRRLVVVVFTSSDDAQDINRAYELGANSYVQKPSDIGKLEKTIRSLHDYWLDVNLCPECGLPAAPSQPSLRVMLRNVETGKYLSNERKWTDNPGHAVDFERSESAVQTALQLDLPNLELIISRDNERQTLKLGLERRQRRPASSVSKD